MKNNKKHPKEIIRESLETIWMFSKETPYETYIQVQIERIKKQLTKLK